MSKWIALFYPAFGLGTGLYYLIFADNSVSKRIASLMVMASAAATLWFIWGRS